MEGILIAVVMFAPLALALGGVLAWVLWLKRDRRRSPLNLDPFHFPAESLRRQMAVLEERFSDLTVQVIVIGPILFSTWLAVRAKNVGWSQLKLGWFDLFFALAAFGAAIWYAVRLVRLGRRLRQHREGIAAELAVAQYLLVLPEQGYRVLHDIPCRDFNIDHVVIGQSAVFAIETKSRKKPEARGKASARVEFDGKVLRFPTHVEARPLDQARANARWLAEVLRKELNESIPVVPVVALPGWFVELTREGAMSDVIVNNCKVPGFVKSARYGPPLAPTARSRIRGVLARRYEIAEAARQRD